MILYCCLCRHRNNLTGVAFPSRRTIANECGIGKVDTVDKALKQLCEVGLIEKHHQYAPNGGYKSNIYTIPEIGDMGTEPVQPYLIEPKMNELIIKNEARKATMTTLERIARFHLEFEGVHPFVDGNGRTGRLILNLELIREGFPPINVKFTDRKRYYDAFDAYYRDGDAGKMIDLIAEYVDKRLDEYLAVLGK